MLLDFKPSELLWSQGVGAFCDFAGPDWYRVETTESQQTADFFREHFRGAHGLVWVRLSTLARDDVPCDLDIFVETVLPTITRPFALVTTDGDASVPWDLRHVTVKALLDNPLLVGWYSQNCIGGHPKLKPYPIGLDLHTARSDMTPSEVARLFLEISESAAPVEERQLKIFCDLNLSLASDDRRHIVKTMRGLEHIAFPEARMAVADSWRAYAAHPLAVSAAGNGLDSHRTWELLYLGCIVITKTSPLDWLYEGLPVVILQDWAELADAGRMRGWVQQMAPLTRPSHIRERLRPEAWLAPLRQALAEAERADAPS